MKRFPWATNEWAKKITIRNADNNYYSRGLLFAMRGEKEKANEYFDKIKNKKMLSTLVEDFH